MVVALANGFEGESGAAEKSVVSGMSCERGNIMPASALNDGYCDCPDGSDEPGTSSCSSVVAEEKFVCRNEGHEQTLVSLSRVEDGICDCCDGSDEPSGVCQDSCREAAARAAEAARQEEWVRTNGGLKRREMACEAQEKMNRAQQDLDETKEKISTEERTLETVQADLDAARENQRLAIDADARSRMYEALGLDSLEPDRVYKILVDLATTTDATSLLVNLIKEANGLPYDELTYDRFAHCPFSTPDDAEQGDEYGYHVEKDDELSVEDEEGMDVDESFEDEESIIDEVEGDIESFSALDQEEETTPELDDGMSDEDAEKMAKARAEMASFMGDDVVHDGAYEYGGYNFPEDDDDDYMYGYGSRSRDDYHYPPSTAEEDVNSESSRDVDDDEDASSLFSLSKYRRTGEEVMSSRELKAMKALEEKVEKMSSKLKKRKNKHEKAKAVLAGDFAGVPEDRALLGLRDTCLKHDNQGYTYEICFFDRAKQGHTSLGKFRRVETDEKNASKMFFDQGQSCYNGPKRSLTVEFVCGIENEIKEIDEPETCVYVASVGTPAVCPVPTNTDLSHRSSCETTTTRGSSFLESLYKPLDFKFFN